MGSKKKRFSTNSNKKWKFVDIIFLLFIFIINLIVFFNGGIEETRNIFNNTDSLLVILLWILFIFIIIFVRSIPYVAIYYGFIYVIKKYNLSRTTFNVTTDMDYYRDMIKNVSPSTMSLLMDLTLEKTKDIGAMKLYYELNDVYYYVKDGSMYLNNPNNIKINKSDDILLDYFYKKKNDLFIINEWKETVICENVNNNLVQRKTKLEKKKYGCGFGCLFSLFSFAYIIWAMVYIYFNIIDFEDFFTQLESLTSSDNLSALIFFAENTQYLKYLLILLFVPIAIFGGFWGTISSLIHTFVSASISVKDNIKRTQEGNELAEKLYGMKNFIHNFSNLDEATKKHLVLWKDFLVYAVVLEENEIILKEISDTFNTNLIDYRNYK